MNLNGHRLCDPSKFFLHNHRLCSIGSDDFNEDHVARSMRLHTWSFDDAHSDLLRIADRHFNPLGIRFRFFVCPDLIDKTELGRKDYVCAQLKDKNARLLDWNNIRYLISCGHYIGSHGLDHAAFDCMSIEEVSRQLTISKYRIAENVGILPDTFAVPFGRLHLDNAEMSNLIFKCYSRVYLSDNRIPLGSYNGFVNRRHAEFGQGYFRSLAIGGLNIYGIRKQ
jgi:hypothetical protein